MEGEEEGDMSLLSPADMSHLLSGKTSTCTCSSSSTLR